MKKKLRILLLCHHYAGIAGALTDHIFSFEKYSKHEFFILSNLGDLPKWLDLDRFDAIIFHFTLIAANNNFISPAGRRAIRNFKGYKVAFVQDDYRWINQTVNAFSFMRINSLFCLTPENIINEIYSPSRLKNVRIETLLPGYVSEQLLKIKPKPYSDRSIDVGYRARKLDAWIGEFAIQKWEIGEKFMNHPSTKKIKTDIAFDEESRLYGDDWIKFVSNCKAMLGTESGASVADFTGNIQKNVEKHLKKNPNADFYELRELYFKNEDNKLIINTISPRCFEAAALKTLMVMYDGFYAGILNPNHHYVVLRRDYSNINEVIKIINTPKLAKKYIDNAYNEIALNERYSYKYMVKFVDRVIAEGINESMLSKKKPYEKMEFNLFVKRSIFLKEKLMKHLWLKLPLKLRLILKPIILNLIQFYKKFSFVVLYNKFFSLLYKLWSLLPRKLKNIIRFFLFKKMK